MPGNPEDFLQITRLPRLSALPAPSITLVSNRVPGKHTGSGLAQAMAGGAGAHVKKARPAAPDRNPGGGGGGGAAMYI